MKYKKFAATAIMAVAATGSAAGPSGALCGIDLPVGALIGPLIAGRPNPINPGIAYCSGQP
ncbi:hypothetical protein ACW2Q0_16420 [Nocardia sp. R16R-3T]